MSKRTGNEISGVSLDADAKRSKVGLEPVESSNVGPIELEERKEADGVLARAQKMGLVNMSFSSIAYLQ